jgi:hypothetical protein
MREHLFNLMMFYINQRAYVTYNGKVGYLVMESTFFLAPPITQNPRLLRLPVGPEIYFRKFSGYLHLVSSYRHVMAPLGADIMDSLLNSPYISTASSRQDLPPSCKLLFKKQISSLKSMTKNASIEIPQ